MEKLAFYLYGKVSPYCEFLFFIGFVMGTTGALSERHEHNAASPLITYAGLFICTVALTFWRRK